MENNGTESDVFASRRHLLIAVDDSGKAGRAVSYVADVVCGSRGFKVTLLNIIPLPSPDFFKNDEERNRWIASRRQDAERGFDECRMLLAESGLKEEDISLEVLVKDCRSLADCILEERARLGCGTVVIARRGISLKEEFMFGSTSSRIVHQARDCAVWVVE